MTLASPLRAHHETPLLGSSHNTQPAPPVSCNKYHRSRYERTRRLRLAGIVAGVFIGLLCLVAVFDGRDRTSSRHSRGQKHDPHRASYDNDHAYAHSSVRSYFERARSFLVSGNTGDTGLVEPAWTGNGDSLFFDTPEDPSAAAGGGDEEPYFCPCCGWSGHAFADYNGRPNAGCPVCGVSERHRFACYLFQTELQDVIKCATPEQPQRFLHYVPTEQIVRRLDRVPNFDQILVDFRKNIPGLVQIDPDNMRIPDNFLNGIMLAHVLEHAKDDKIAFAEVNRVLKPEGWMIVEVPCQSNLDANVQCSVKMSGEEREKVCGHKNHFRKYSCGAFRQQLVDAGFECNLPYMNEDQLSRLTTHIIPKQFLCWRVHEEGDVAQIAGGDHHSYED